MAIMLIARFDDEVRELITAYDRAHALIMSRGGATGVGERRHYCATDESSLYIIGVWESEELVRARWDSKEFEETLTSLGFPSPSTAHLTVLALHATEPPLSARRRGALDARKHPDRGHKGRTVRSLFAADRGNRASPPTRRPSAIRAVRGAR